MALSALVKVQADIQKVLKPAMWLPVIRTPHYYSERWTSDGGDAASFLEDVQKSVAALESSTRDDGTLFRLSTAAGDTVTVCCFTKSRWLDLVDIKVAHESGKTQATVRGYSTGLFPLSIPGAVLLNPLFCWFPFDDHGFSRNVWLPAIRNGLSAACTVDQQGRKW
eukprot:TRINITY_DN1943_c0_g1_i1.p1 TRINITY_DN1943_c0_g1~~TRINITY_DN1943_c0_g1_i1.p1  ORF type:complete len:166 (-),score=46.57 TRINITY_DN1943_c0_g1_i1:532-1029(-)